MIAVIAVLYMLSHATSSYDPAIMMSGSTSGFYREGVVHVPPIQVPFRVRQECLLPISLGTGIVAAKLKGCVAGGALARGARCEVTCDRNYFASGYPTIGATRHWRHYECSRATLALLQPSLECTVFSEFRCPLPAQFSEGHASADVNGCTPGGWLLPLQDPAATVLNTGCAVQCERGYLGDAGSRRYTCLSGPEFARTPALRCVPAGESSCVLPRSFGAGVKGATCQAGSELANRAKCTVTCQADHMMEDGQTSDDFAYSCLGGRLDVPAARCRPTANGKELKIAGHELTMSLVGHLNRFGLAERATLASYLAEKLGVNADKDLLLSFSVGSVVVSGIVRGSNAAAIIELAYGLTTRFDDTWPLMSYPVMTAKYDGPVLQTAQIAHCRMMLHQRTSHRLPPLVHGYGWHDAQPSHILLCTVPV